MHTPPQNPPVLMVTDGYGRGGTELHLLDLSRGLVTRGFPVGAVLSPRDDLRWLGEEMVRAGAQVHLVSERGGSPLSAVHRLAELVRVIRRYRGCILHLHFVKFHGGGLAVLAGLLGGARAIVRSEHNPPLGEIGATGRRAVQVRDRATARFVFTSEEQRRAHVELLKRDPSKCVIVPLGIDVERFSPRAPDRALFVELGLDPAAPTVGTVARLEGPRKGLAYFLEMAAVVARSRREVRFIVVGDGPYRSELQRHATALGVDDRVLFAGSRQDVPRMLAAMRVFVMPSLIESGPYTVIEAMAMRRPVVSTPVGMVPDFMHDRENGLLVPTEDSAALARAVLELLSDEPLADRLAQRGHDLIVERYSLDAMVDNIIRVYREVA